MVLNFTAADDFGRIINPLIGKGQVHGGLVQGIGQALYEDRIYYAESGQLRTGSLMDYCLPRANQVPAFNLSTHETLCAHNPLGAKGCGEAGTIGAPAAIMNAMVNAETERLVAVYRNANEVIVGTEDQTYSRRGLINRTTFTAAEIGDRIVSVLERRLAAMRSDLQKLRAEEQGRSR